MNKKNILKSFVQGETIELSVDGVERKSTFIRVSGRTLTLSNDDKEEEIDLGRIDRITL
ncbi:hypothetical protein IR083_07735 [Dysgonomonas sp. GY75]|uniref:hypothetical protein n=1 Tax=Dysgonomonas sp. GY75 TaxID=2780419 RepID=UPI00188437CF|nr:hypothetical protein [Dysgonomonas sp. GY75]MBF0648708.1 hypothetical protein [Dysgonomonas sp. GY75]